MPDKKYIDIKIVDGGWQIDAGQQPTLCSDLYSISQDIKHSIMESGLARELIAERSPVLRSDVLIQIEQLAEQDLRIIPGTATANATEANDITLTAETYEFGKDMSFPEVKVNIITIESSEHDDIEPEQPDDIEPDNPDDTEPDNQDGTEPDNQDDTEPDNQDGTEPDNQDGTEPDNQDGTTNAKWSDKQNEWV